MHLPLSGLITDWEGNLAGDMTMGIDRIRMATQTDRPTGDDSFVAKVANLTDQGLSKGKARRRNNNRYYVPGICRIWNMANLTDQGLSKGKARRRNNNRYYVPGICPEYAAKKQ